VGAHTFLKISYQGSFGNLFTDRSFTVFNPVPIATFITPRTSSLDKMVLALETTGVLDMQRERAYKKRSLI
jgi:hypothetical protein